MNRVTIRLKSLEHGYESKEVDLEDIIFNQECVEFEFGDYDDDYSTLPYSDFLFFRDEYQVIVKIKGE